METFLLSTYQRILPNLEREIHVLGVDAYPRQGGGASGEIFSQQQMGQNSDAPAVSAFSNPPLSPISLVLSFVYGKMSWIHNPDSHCTKGDSKDFTWITDEEVQISAGKNVGWLCSRGGRHWGRRKWRSIVS
jgi:hypothetical protein